MKTPKHTPGPWTIHDSASPENFTIDLRANDGSLSVASIAHNFIEEAEANAALIASAPDLYAACEIVLNNLTVMIPANEDLRKLGEKACVDTLIAALKKARGES